VSYSLRIARAARKDLDRLPPPTEQRVARRLQELRLNPLDPRLAKPLTGYPGLYSSRVGDWRILFELHATEDAAFLGMVLITAVEPRGRVYRRL
jgi:mRNA-degrading endonuclease RelE of RelBE toxin-antitoxin system